MGPEEKVNILLVDDQPSKLLSYEAVLQDLGENLVKASSAREALEHLLKSDFALILVDVCMPEQDGFELAETIRSHHRFRQTAIIFVSAIQMTDLDRMKGYASGAVDYVSVPIVPEILRAKVAIFVDLYRKTRQLERMNVELEERVLERTAKLRETEEALREADRRKDVFLATLAHELRNPLAPVRSAAEMLKLVGKDHPVVGNASEVIDRQVGQMVRLIDDLMDLGRITRNSLEIRRESTDLASILQVAVDVARPAFEAARQKFVMTLPPSPVEVEVDKARVSQVIANLLNNASKYTPDHGAIRLEARLEASDLVVTVEDSGIGIEPSQIPRVFEAFYQVGATDGSGRGGLGLGLTLVKNIVELHGGTVEAESDGDGAGTRFVVRLPCVSRPLENGRAAKSAEAKAREGAPLKVLVVDDNEDAALTLATLLAHLGNEVSVAHEGRVAVELANRIQPDLIFLDLGMPGMNGCDVAVEIRARDWGHRPFIVAVTGWGQTEDRRRTSESGFDRHFVKPVGIEEIESVLAGLGKATQPVGPSRSAVVDR